MIQSLQVLDQADVDASVGKVRPMLTVASEPTQSTDDASKGPQSSSVPGSLLDELVRDGARRMLAAALEAEVAAYIDAHAGQVDEAGRRLVVRNGHHQPREVMTAAGAVDVHAPRGATSASMT